MLAVALCVVGTGCPPVNDPPGMTTTTEPLGQIRPDECLPLKAQGAASIRFYADSDPWNTPVACLKQASDSSRWADNWFENSNRAAFTGQQDWKGHLSIGLTSYSTPIYDVATATTTIRVRSANYPDNLDGQLTIPWNPNWLPSAGNDSEMILINRQNGSELGLWLVPRPPTPVNPSGRIANCVLPFEAWDPPLEDYDLCVGQAVVGRTPAGEISDFRSDTGVADVAKRGMGAVNPLVMLTRIEEVESGEIHHALNNEMYNTLFGPPCTGVQLNDPTQAGTSCGYAVEPASRLENQLGPEPACHPSVAMANTSADRMRTVPEGTRFYLDLSRTEIDDRLEKKGYSVGKLETAKVFAYALRDYGWVVSDTGCWDSLTSVEGAVSPEAKARWDALELTEAGASGLLDGLITKDAVKTVAPPSARKITVGW